MQKYKVVIIDEDEARQEVVLTELSQALACARANRWATIYSLTT